MAMRHALPSLAVALALLSGCADDGTPAPVAAGGTSGGPIPTLLQVAPVDGDVAGGTTLTLTGGGFASGARVLVGGTDATGLTILSATQCVATTPAGPAGPAHVTFRSKAGANASLAWGFTYTSGGAGPAPMLGSVAPARGPAAGGQTVTCTGSGFRAGIGVTFRGTAATGVTLLAGSLLTCVTPAGAPGFADVTVTNADLQSATRTAAYDYAPALVEGLTDPAADPDVAIDGSGNLHVVWQATPGGGAADVRYVRSTDGGATWTATPLDLSASSNACTRPRIAARGTRVLVVWAEANASSGVGEVGHAYSTDGGATWSSPAVLATTNVSAPAVTPAAALDSNGDLVVAYGDTNVVPPGSGMPNFALVMIARGTLGGTATTTMLGINFGLPAVATSGSTVCVAVGNGYGVDVVRSTDDGVTWGSAPWTATPPSGSAYFQPAIALSGSTGVLAMLSATSSGVKVEWRRSTDGGASFGSASTLATWSIPSGALLAPGPFAPAVAVEGNGAFTVAYASPSAGNGDVWSARSTDGGQTFASARNLSLNAGVSQTVRVAGGPGTARFHVWADDTAWGGTPDVLGY